MMHNCIKGMQEPRYGFVTQIHLVTDELCEFNVTCTANGDKIQGSLDRNDGPAIASYQYHTRPYPWRRHYYQPLYTSLNRQTGEDFTSAGPPRCRVTGC